MELYKLLLVTVLLLLQFIGGFAAISFQLRVENQAGSPIDIYWINEEDGQYEKQNGKPIRQSAHFIVNSYETHKFAIRFHHDNVETEEALIVKGSSDETFVVTFDEEKNALLAKAITTYDTVLPKVEAATAACRHLTSKADYVQCISKLVVKDVGKVSNAKAQLGKFRDAISSRLRNYTCADRAMPTSTPLYHIQKTVDGRPYDMAFYLNMSHAKIWFIDNFISAAECDVLMNHGRPRLTRATVAAEDGSSIVSENRKAQQAMYDLHYHNGEKDPLWNLHKRILNIMNDINGYGLESAGQEGFTIIQYNPSDQYTPHCDGACDNDMVNAGGRIGTAVLYCKEPEAGGATSFTKADVFVKPKKGAVTFFSYKGSDDRMDDGYTEHSGCPVLEGEKWITTFWMRHGVTAEDNWTKFDPSGGRLL